MFKPKTLRLAAIAAILLSLVALAGGIVELVQTGKVFLGILSAAMMLGASYIGYRLISYPLDAEELRRVGLRIYLIIAAFGVFLFAGLLIGLLLSATMLATLWGLKNSYDEKGR